MTQEDDKYKEMDEILKIPASVKLGKGFIMK
jgi:hypothetical protein